VGDPVRFHEEAGEEGPQASTVRLVTKARPTTALPPERRRSTNRKTA
jgi:hypothetical protein